MADHPLKPIEDLDAGLFNLMQESRELSMEEGAIPKKYKILIALALDAAHGATDGVAYIRVGRSAHGKVYLGASSREYAPRCL